MDVGLTNSSYVVNEIKMVVLGLLTSTCSSSAEDDRRYWEDVEKHIEKLQKKIWM